MGYPYVSGGSSPDTGFDCSGFVSYVYAQFGISLPRSSGAYYNIGTRVDTPQPGDIIVAGKNFGCGSSREHAPIAIKASGIACVVAKSFARIFYRNAINTGLPIVEYDGDIRDGDLLDIDFANGVIRNHRDNTQGRFTPFPEFLQKIITAGGLFKAKEIMQ